MTKKLDCFYKLNREVKSPIFCFYICREKNGKYFGKVKKPKNPEGQKKKV